jgi:hypothetical protein
MRDVASIPCAAVQSAANCARNGVALFGGFMQDAVTKRAKLPVCGRSQPT